MENKIKTPVMIVTSDRWSSSPYIVFEGEELIGYAIPNEWIDQRFYEYERQCEENGDPIESTREEIAEEMESDFEAENTVVDGFNVEKMICWHKQKGEFVAYKYFESGTARYIGTFDDVSEIDEVSND